MTAEVKRGRPARLSREQIVHTAVDLLLDGSGRPLSIHRLARALDITPMAIYRHLENKDALMQAVALELLGRFQPQIPEAEWPVQLQIWARETRAYFLQHPVFFSILGWQEHIAVAWLQQLAVLTRIVAKTGIEDGALAEAVQWTANTLMGSIYFEISSRQSGVKVSQNDIDCLSEGDGKVVRGIMAHLLNKDPDAVFEACVERVIESLGAQSPCHTLSLEEESCTGA